MSDNLTKIELRYWRTLAAKYRRQMLKAQEEGNSFAESVYSDKLDHAAAELARLECAWE
jgi:hypothetical protein